MFKKNSKSHKISDWASICTKIFQDISSRLWIIGVWKVENRTHTRTSGNQLKIAFLDVLDYSEYFDTDILIFFHEKVASTVRKQKKLSNK